MITFPFTDVINAIRNAKKGVEVRENLAQMGEYCKQFTEEAGQKANAARDEANGYAAAAKASEKKATDAVAGIEQTKTDAVQAVQNAQTTATTAVQQAQSTATTAVTTKQTEAVQAVGAAQTGAVKAVDDERDAALQQVANSTQAAQTAASNAEASAQAAQASKEAAAASAGAAESSATAASGSASAAATSESNAATSAKSAGTDADRAEAAAELAGTRANTDKTLKIENAPADAAAVGAALGKKLDLTGGTLNGPLIFPGSLTALGYANNAGNRNAMPPRDRSLGAPTTEHFEMIASDKYNELFLGDYWTVDGVDWVIGDFKFWHNTGDTACEKPHVVVFPRNNLYTYKFNPTNTTEGGYVGSDLYKNGLTQAKQMVTAAFGSAHILSHREYLVNAVTNGVPTGTDWYDSTVELMNENMVYGSRQFSPMLNGAINPQKTCRNYTIDKSQLSLFRYEPWTICNSNWYWLRDVVSTTYFADVDRTGNVDIGNAIGDGGIRPVVGIC